MPGLLSSSLRPRFKASLIYMRVEPGPSSSTMISTQLRRPASAPSGTTAGGRRQPDAGIGMARCILEKIANGFLDILLLHGERQAGRRSGKDRRSCPG